MGDTWILPHSASLRLSSSRACYARDMQKRLRHGQRSLFLILLCLVQACGGSNSWETVVGKARDSNKVLIIEFYADWCTPCTWFEKNVLSDAEVKTALKQVEFRRYNYDSTVGRKHADRLGIRSIPTVVAIDRNGKGYRKLKGAVPKSTFLEFLHWSHEQLYPSSEPSS